MTPTNAAHSAPTAAASREPGTHVLNYPGDVTADMQPGQRTTPFGVPLLSNLWGLVTQSGSGYPLEVRDATYDVAADRTRVVLIPAAGGES